jgi:hypothetical protein
VLAFIYAASDATESPAVAFPGPPRGSALPEAHVVATSRSFAWFFSSGESGWGQLRSHNSSVAQTLQGLIECASILPSTVGRVVVTIQSQALMNAIREDRLPSRRVGGLLRTLRERLSGLQVEVNLADRADPSHRERMKVLRDAERENVLPTAVEGRGWLRLSSYAGIEAGPALEGARLPALHSYDSLPGIVDLQAAADLDEAKAISRIVSPPTRLLYPKVEAGILLGVSARSVDYLISAGRLKTVRIGKRNLIPADELRRFARADRPAPIRPLSQLPTVN